MCTLEETCCAYYHGLFEKGRLVAGQSLEAKINDDGEMEMNLDEGFWSATTQ